MLGSQFISPNTARFRVWAPFQETLHLQLANRRAIPMAKDGKGYFSAEVDSVEEGDLYFYQFPDGSRRPDPAARFLPEGPFGPSSLVKPDFGWTDSEWKGIEQKDLIFYEIHIGTFSPEGTFLGALERIPYLQKLGVTCLSLMPIAQFSGKCNWGYDWSCAFAPHNAYGTPGELKELINACHRAGIAICLDVVYNHFGPEGCLLYDFGPYATDKYQTGWGKSMNFDGPYSDEVRCFFIQNAIYWIEEFHCDALRLDATHAIFDAGAVTFIEQLISSIPNRAFIIVENNLNNSRLICPTSKGGFGADAFWNDDFHHALHVALTGERQAYYEDYSKGLEDLKTVLKEGALFGGSRYSSYRKSTYGRTFKNIPPLKLIAFLQNHDQIGNRPSGDRISLSYPLQKMTAALLMFSPFLPLLFMGQEYGEKNPFQYFIDFDSRELIQSICEDRGKEFSQNAAIDLSAFLKSKLSWNIDQTLFNLYRQLIVLRKQLNPASNIPAIIGGTESSIRIEYPDFAVFCAFFPGEYSLPETDRKLLLHTEQDEFGGTGSVVFQKQRLSVSCPMGALFIK